MAKQTPQQFVKAALAAEREQWTGEREQFSLDDAKPAPLIDPQDRAPMAACVVGFVWLIASAVAEHLPRVCT